MAAYTRRLTRWGPSRRSTLTLAPALTSALAAAQFPSASALARGVSPSGSRGSSSGLCCSSSSTASAPGHSAARCSAEGPRPPRTAAAASAPSSSSRKRRRARRRARGSPRSSLWRPRARRVTRRGVRPSRSCPLAAWRSTSRGERASDSWPSAHGGCLSRALSRGSTSLPCARRATWWSSPGDPARALGSGWQPDSSRRSTSTRLPLCRASERGLCCSLLRAAGSQPLLSRRDATCSRQRSCSARSFSRTTPRPSVSEAPPEQRSCSCCCSLSLNSLSARAR
uniref:Uncharacterized protein n=1 Tax=Ixodes ricinus TaxID=34613 RepID=A0A6B0V7B7_IXORI